MQRPRVRSALLSAGLCAALAVASFLASAPAYAAPRQHSDFNGDGYDDLAVAIPGYQVGNVEDAGAIVIVPGGPRSLNPGGATQIWHRGSDGIPGVQTANERWGLVLQTGDFNGDGYDDLAVGSPVATIDNQPNRGDVVILFGSRDGLRTEGVQQLLPDPALGAALFGASLTVGNFNADPLADLAVGAPGANSGSGAVIVYQSAYIGPMTQNTLLTPDMVVIDDPGQQSEAQAFGAAIAAGAFNHIGLGPGLDDIAIASRQRNRGGSGGTGPGRIYIAHGGADQTTHGPGFGPVTEFFDLDMASELVPDGSLYATILQAADFDGDGLDDLAIAMPTAGVHGDEGDVSHAGALMILYGGSSGFATERLETLLEDMVGFRDQVETGDEFATAVATGDLDHDGFLDLVIGTPLEDDFGQTDRGTVHLVYGTDHGLDTIRRATLQQDLTYYPVDLGPSRNGDMFGGSLGIGDFNGDGYADVAIGILGKQGPDGIANVGAVLAIRGSTQGAFTAASTIISHRTLTGLDLPVHANDYFGLALSDGTGTCGLTALCMRLR